MDSECLRPLTMEKGPFVSVYFDGSCNVADADDLLAATWRDLRRHLEDEGADKAVVRTLQRTVLNGQPAVGRQGRAIIAAGEHVLINEHLAIPPAMPVVRVSDYPYLVPLVELSRSRPPYVFAAVDHAGADITVHLRDTSRHETVDGGGFPVHKPVTAGWKGYGDLQHTTEEAVRMNVRAVADRLTALVDETEPEVVFVCGEVRSRTDVVSALPDRVRQRVSALQAGPRGHRAREAEMADEIDAEFERRRQAHIAKTVDRFSTEKGRRSGLAVEGLAPVCAALREGGVETLIVGNVGDATVLTGQDRCTVAPDADVLSELGEVPVRVARADEALPFAAVAIGAGLIPADHRFAPADGIAALLRYPRPVRRIGDASGEPAAR